MRNLLALCCTALAFSVLPLQAQTASPAPVEPNIVAPEASAAPGGLNVDARINAMLDKPADWAEAIVFFPS
ncbi:MAG: hypothetical protein H0V56_02710, partial [Chthoniobacterales bacterium]|nr:hypothetical protein [Chthoniobacterales bacterium]